MTELILCRGVPASGKSTYAKAWILAGERRVRVNRDDLRMQMFGKLTGVDERLVTKAEDAIIDRALKANYSVIVDDTNIAKDYIDRMALIGWANGAEVSIKSFIVPLNTALERNVERHSKGGAFVPEEVIQKMHARLASSPMEDGVLVPVEAEKYEPKKDTLRAIIVDIDGTLAHMGDRSPYEWHRVSRDEPDTIVMKVVHWAADSGYQVIVMSGRDEICRSDTAEWLDHHKIWFDRLIMRPEGDMRKDSIVKRELFDKYVRDEYDVLFVLDDRQQVVDMWRSMGLKCFQVAPGDF